MDVDPTRNTIVFEVKRLWKKQTFIEQSPTRSEDGIEAAWRIVQIKNGVQPGQVRQIYAEWEPSEQDAAFLSATFPHAKVSYSFSRPDESDWDAALAEASHAMQESMGEQLRSETHDRREKGKAILFPVLRNYEEGNILSDAIVHRVLGANLAVFLAHVGPTPHGTIGIDYLMRANVDASESALDGLFETAWQNLRSGLRVEAGEVHGAKVFRLTHPNNMAASTLGLPEFHEQVRSWLGQPEVFVAFTDPDNLFVTLANTPAAEELRKSVEQSEYWGSVALTPACFIQNISGLRLISARPAPA